MPTPIIIAGHSHANRLGLARGDNAVVLKELRQGSPPVLGSSANWPLLANFAEIIRGHSASRHLMLLWGGNDHMARFLFAPTPLFDFVSSTLLPGRLADNAILIPEALVETTYPRCADGLRRALVVVQEGHPASITSSPPPRRATQAKSPRARRQTLSCSMNPAFTMSRK